MILTAARPRALVRFGLDDVGYEIDLSVAHSEELHKALAPYIAHARKVGGTRRAVRGRWDGSAIDTHKIREWARSQGIDIKDRGRVPADIAAEIPPGNRTITRPRALLPDSRREGGRAAHTPFDVEQRGGGAKASRFRMPLVIERELMAPEPELVSPNLSGATAYSMSPAGNHGDSGSKPKVRHSQSG